MYCEKRYTNTYTVTWLDKFCVCVCVYMLCVCVCMFMWFMRTQMCIMTWIWQVLQGEGELGGHCVCVRACVRACVCVCVCVGQWKMHLFCCQSIPGPCEKKKNGSATPECNSSDCRWYKQKIFMPVEMWSLTSWLGQTLASKFYPSVSWLPCRTSRALSGECGTLWRAGERPAWSGFDLY